MADVIRDPRYWLSLAVLIGVIVVSAATGGSGTSVSDATGEPVIVATPSPVGPSPADAELDQKRSEDLATIAEVLETYRATHGAYPSTHNEFGTVCDMPFDAGCQLIDTSWKLPVSDGTYPYWWQSDGRAYTLFTRVQTPVTDTACPAIVPPALTGLDLVCRNGGDR